MNLTARLLAFVAIATALALPAAAQTKTLTVTMTALNGSGENGTATLTQLSKGVQVVVKLVNAPKDPQPTHIHIGTCGHINAQPEYPLNNTVDGASTSIVSGVTIDQLLKGHYAINVHKSTSDLATYVSCGDIVPPKR
jgi:Cu/Zn superoxide dismutase